ncbi:MAG: peptide ABC transporter substrate-binding protein [Oscillospiraceae bacterium]
MNFLKRLISAALLSICLVTFTACTEDDGSNGVFKYNIAANPQSLDPQTAADSVSDLLISNIYMGLLVVNPDGSLGSGVAEDYSVSDDGLIYTFRLRKDIYWIDSGDFEAQCTAHDFVFAFRRLFDPNTRAARASDYYCIKNAERVNKGYIPIVSEVGVEAVDDFVLKITLEYPNPQFPQLLTNTPAMPCNEEYFVKSQGKYGLSAEATPSNGSFYLRTWEYDPYTITDNNFIVLRRNHKTNEINKVYPSGLNFFIVDEERFVRDFVSGTTDCIAVTDDQAAAISGEYTVEAYSNISVGMIFNTKFDLFSSTDFRRALACLVNREEISASLAQYNPSRGVVPDEVTLLDKAYRDYVGKDLVAGYDRDKAMAYYSQAEDSLDKDLFAGARIILPDDTMVDAVSYIMQEWQKQLGFYCVVEVLPLEQYEQRLQSGDFEIAVVELTGGYNSPEAYLGAFLPDSSANYSSYRNRMFQNYIRQASRAHDLSESAELYLKAEEILLDEAAFVPLCCKNVYFFMNEDVSDIYYNPFSKTVGFSQAKTD